jgi:hypothetical protein
VGARQCRFQLLDLAIGDSHHLFDPPGLVWRDVAKTFQRHEVDVVPERLEHGSESLGQLLVDRQMTWRRSAGQMAVSKLGDFLDQASAGRTDGVDNGRLEQRGPLWLRRTAPIPGVGEQVDLNDGRDLGEDRNLAEKALRLGAGARILNRLDLNQGVDCRQRNAA